MPIYRKEAKTIGYVLPISNISRKFARRIDTATTKNAGGTRNMLIEGNPWIGSAKHYSYISKSYKDHLVVRTVSAYRAATGDQIHNRTIFSAASSWVSAAMRDLMAVSTNQQKFLQSRDDPSKKIKGINARTYSVRGWMFAVAFAIKKDTGDLPQDHLLPAFDA